jgi:hypothetical protein
MPAQAGIFFLPRSVDSSKGADTMMRRISVLGLAAGLVGGALSGGGSAGATEFCDIKQTPDGFIALRARPDAKGKLVARMKPGDEVMLNNIVAEKNGWTRVYWWKGGRFQGQTVKGIESADAQGWVNSRLLGDECG